MRPTKQVYGNYTAEDFAVWKTLFNRQMSGLEHSVSREYLKAIEKLNNDGTWVKNKKNNIIKADLKLENEISILRQYK